MALPSGYRFESEAVLAQVHAAEGDLAGAEELYFRTQEEACLQADADSLDCARASLRLGEFLLELEQFDLAEEQILRGVHILEQEVLVSEPLLARARKAAAAVLEAQGKHGEASEFRD